MKFTTLIPILIIIMSLIFTSGCLSKCPISQTVTVTPVSIEKEQGLANTKYHVTFEIFNNGTEIEKSLSINFNMNSGSDWDHSNNETRTVNELKPGEKRKIVIDFSSILFSLNEKNFSGISYNTKDFCTLSI